jgi:polygalacturonase
MFTKYFSCALLSLGLANAHTLKDFGAQESIDTNSASQKNSRAFEQALSAAAHKQNGDNTVHIPSGETYTLFPVFASDFSDVDIVVDGTLLMNQDQFNWPLLPYPGHHSSGENHRDKVQDCLHFENIENVTFTGEGIIDGRGFSWWVREFTHQNPNRRPNMLSVQGGRNLHFSGIRYVNSPRFHLYVHDVDQVVFEDFEIDVDVFGQMKLANFFGFNLGPALDSLASAAFPMFPLNTDGIDPAGSNIMIRRVNITNYDDGIAIKPMHGGSGCKYAQNCCSENISAHDMYIFNSVGMSIGSVPPNKDFACVRNIHFKDIVMDYPIKGIYVKTNPQHFNTNDTGVIENVVYENIKLNRAIWWGIYIGPQQMMEPDGRGPGCMLYPLMTSCDTNPTVPMRNITLRNIEGKGSLLPPGILRCNETNPCTDFTFDNVQLSGWWDWFGYGFITENVQGKVTNSYPDPGFDNSYGVSKKMVDPIQVFFKIVAQLEEFSVEALFSLVKKMLSEIIFG